MQGIKHEIAFKWIKIKQKSSKVPKKLALPASFLTFTQQYAGEA
ncbi:hypothetical protein PPHE_a0014 [Pseudoalteromonas phenolica O-BC30]|nr:hypothetical protein [Pseudoalteromonas phenolica O-BC30]